MLLASEDIKQKQTNKTHNVIVQELSESRGGRPNEPSGFSLDVKLYWTMLRHWSQLAPNMSADIRGH